MIKPIRPTLLLAVAAGLWWDARQPRILRVARTWRFGINTAYSNQLHQSLKREIVVRDHSPRSAMPALCSNRVIARQIDLLLTEEFVATDTLILNNAFICF